MQMAAVCNNAKIIHHMCKSLCVAKCGSGNDIPEMLQVEHRAAACMYASATAPLPEGP